MRHRRLACASHSRGRLCHTAILAASSSSLRTSVRPRGGSARRAGDKGHRFSFAFRFSISVASRARKPAGAVSSVWMTRTTNSSPPMRAMMSESRKVAFRICAASRMRRSPSAWPNRSFVALRPSTSEKRRNSPVLVRRATLICCSASVKKPRRFARPVSSSSSESARMASSARFRSTAYRIERTMRAPSALPLIRKSWAPLRTASVAIASSSRPVSTIMGRRGLSAIACSTVARPRLSGRERSSSTASNRPSSRCGRASAIVSA